jgi:hypothetical protein
MLQSALRQYRQQQRVSLLGLRQMRKAAPRGSHTVARVLSGYQAAAVQLSLESAPQILREQGIPLAQSYTVNGALLLSGDRSAVLFDNAATDAAFDTLSLALIQDAGRTAAAVDMVTRSAVTGYVRTLNGPTCPRCAVLAGRFYRYSQGFQRHPRCDCLMTPTTKAIGPSLITATNLAVDVSRREAGLFIGSSVIARDGRLTPQAVIASTPDRAAALSLLRRLGYVT